MNTKKPSPVRKKDIITKRIIRIIKKAPVPPEVVPELYFLAAQVMTECLDVTGSRNIELVVEQLFDEADKL